MAAMAGGSEDLNTMFDAMLNDMPLRQLSMMAGPAFAGDNLERLLTQLNAEQ